MVFSHFEVLHILIRSEFHLQLPLNIIYKFFLLPEALYCNSTFYDGQSDIMPIYSD